MSATTTIRLTGQNVRYVMANAVVTHSTRTTKSNRRLITLTAKNDMWPCTKCRRSLPADDAMVIQDRIYCTFCAIIEHGYYAKPEEHLPDEYYEELREKNKDDRENLW
jgi:hypothetical protein